MSSAGRDPQAEAGAALPPDMADSEARLRVAVKAADLGIWDWDLRTNEMHYSKEAREICGFAPDGPITLKEVRAITHPDDLPRTWEMAKKATDPEVRSREPYHYRIVRADTGKVRWVQAHGEAIFAVEDGEVRALRYVGTIQDVTDRHRAERALAENEARLRLAMDAGHMAVWEIDLDRDELAHSPEFNELCGFPRDARPTLDEIRARCAPGDLDRLRNEVREALASGRKNFSAEFRLNWPDGTEKWLLLRGQRALDPPAIPARRLIGVLADITEQKRAEAASQWLAAIVESSHDAIVSKDLKGVILTWNPGAERLFGYSAPEAVGRPITIIIPENRHHEEEHILARIRKGERLDHFETVRRHKSGELMHVSLTISPIISKDGVIVGASKIARDITGQKLDQQRIRLLMREVSHRVKNQYAVILSMVRETNKRSRSAAEFETRIRERIMALARSHDLLVAGEWQGSTLKDLILTQVEIFAEDARLSLAGPPVTLSPLAVQYLGIAVHELLTNAIKFGALGLEAGRVTVEWRVTEEADPRIVLRWTEKIAPAPRQSPRVGFGRVVLERITPAALDGKGGLIIDGKGLEWSLEAPLSSVAAERAPHDAFDGRLAKQKF